VVRNTKCTGKVPYLADGHRAGLQRPNNDRKWAPWLSNRHSQLSQLFNTYGNRNTPKYAQYIDFILRRFYNQEHPLPTLKKGGLVMAGLEVRCPTKSMAKIFLRKHNQLAIIFPCQHTILLSSVAPNHSPLQ